MTYEPRKRLAILLGASAWPESELGSSPAYLYAANSIRTFLTDLETVFNDDILFLDLFDDSSPPSELDKSIGEFIKSNKDNYDELLVFFVGHGGFSEDGRDYYLAVRSARKNNYGSSSYSAKNLSHTLQHETPNHKKYLFIDACFSGELAKYFMSSVNEAAFQKMITGIVVSTGTAILCSTSSKNISSLRRDESGTMFTSSLIEVIRDGVQASTSTLSLSAIKNLVVEKIQDSFENCIMPVLHDPEQFNGKNLSDAPLFPNFNVIDDLDTSMHKNAAEAGESLGKKTIKHSFELDVRKGYSKDTNAFESSKLLLDNLFSELCANFDGLYAHFVRQKNIESLLNKLKLRGKSLDSYEQVKQEIKDIIGCRLIVYAPSKIVELHNVLMSYKQFSIKCVTIHSKKYSNEPVVSQIKNLCTKKNIKLIEKEPNSGYFGVHYQFINDPVHEIYKLCKVKPYEVFELQVRTLLQHTWSEIEHKCVYKESITPARDLKPSFLQLSYQLAASDMSLDDIFAATELTPSFKNTEQLDNSQSIFEPLRSKLTTILNQSDSSTSEYYPSIYNEVEQVLNSFKDNIDVLINDPNKENCIVAYDLALAILQSRHYKTALSIYKSYVGWENLGGTIYLRVAECLYGLAGVDQIKRYRAESRTYIEHIRKCIEINEYEPAEKVKLCAGTAMVEWRFGLFGNACFFSKEAINSINVDDRISLFKHRMNHCYYSLENILSIGLDLSDMNSLSKLENLKIEAENAQSHIKVKEIDSAATFDTLAWIYYYNASALNKQGKHAEALKNIIKSVEYINICKNKGVKHHSSKSIWKSHEEKINMLLGVIILDNN